MGIVPDMLTLGRDSFIADGVMLGDEEVDRGWMTMRPTVIGNRSFVGNGARAGRLRAARRRADRRAEPRPANAAWPAADLAGQSAAGPAGASRPPAFPST